MASDFGVDISESTKTVWFEVWPGVENPPTLGCWPDVADSALAEIELRDVPVGLCRAAKRHRAALLREARLALLGSRPVPGVTREELDATAGLNDLIDRSLDSALTAAAAGSPTASLVLAVPPDCGPDLPILANVLERLNQAAASGVFLTRPALPEIRRFRSWLLNEITSQVQGGTACAWCGLEPEPEHASQSRLSTGDLFVDLDSFPSAAVAAGDDNRIIGVNRQAAAMLGWEPDLLVGQRITTLIPFEYRERHIAGFTTFLLTGESRIIGSPVRVSALTRNGATLSIELRISVQQTQTGRTVFIAQLTP